MLARILLATMLLVSNFAFANSNYSEHIMPARDDRWVPWPWSQAKRFPWADISGVWKVEEDNYISYFVFQVVKAKDSNVNQLRIDQYDGQNCQLIASGVGVERNHVVLGQLRSISGDVYRVNLAAFSLEDSPNPPIEGSKFKKAVMGLSIVPTSVGHEDQVVHLQVMQVSRGTSLNSCGPDAE
jgi:hypothetical protein